VESLPGEELLRGTFDLEPVLGDGVVQKLGHILIRSPHQNERSLLVEDFKTPPLDCQGRNQAGHTFPKRTVKNPERSFPMTRPCERSEKKLRVSSLRPAEPSPEVSWVRIGSGL
jgi:hypothetical protein